MGPEARGRLCDRSARPRWSWALLGVLKAGAAYLPLDPDYPADRLRFMLEDSQVGVVLTQDEAGCTAAPERLRR